jgi:hypothetical protein
MSAPLPCSRGGAGVRFYFFNPCIFQMLIKPNPYFFNPCIFQMLIKPNPYFFNPCIWIPSIK